MSMMIGKQKQPETSKPHSDYTNKLASTLNELRKQSELCDVIINIGGRAFPAHKAVLAASSNYFRSMFLHGFKESTESEIQIEGDADIFDVLLEYAYTGEMKIIPEVAFEVLEMACYMQFTDIHKYCSQFMELNKSDKPLDKINMEDCFKLYQLASCHGDLKDVVEKSLKYMCQNIHDLKETKYFLETATSSFLDDFLRRQDLSSEDEEKEVLEMVINWLKYDWDKRQHHTLSLLQQIRLGHVPEESLTKLLHSAEINTIPESQQLFEKALRLQKSEKSKVKRSLDYPDLFATRSTITAPIAITDVEIMDSNDPRYYGEMCPLRQVFYFDIDTKKWILLKRFATLQHLPSLVVSERTLYAVGSGDDEYDDLQPNGKQLLQYDVEHNVWRELASMEKDHEVGSFQMATLNGFLYVIGGMDWSRPNLMNTVERFNLKRKVWQMMCPLPSAADHRCQWTSAIVFEGKIIVYGIKNGQFMQPDEHIIVTYNDSNDSWHTALSEQVSHLDSSYRKPILFLHRDAIYRVMYKSPNRNPTFRSGEFRLHKPVVNKLSLRFLRQAAAITIDRDISQDLIPSNEVGAFRIRNEVFVNMNGFVDKADVRISEDQTEEVNFDAWQNAEVKAFDYSYENSNITKFTFDLKKVGIC